MYHLLHDEPNPEMTSFIFRETLMTHLLLWGNAYAQVIRNGKGEVIALYPLMPNKMSVDRDEQGQFYYTYQRSTDEAATMEGSTVVLRPSDVLHIPGLGFDGLVGYSPIAMAKNAMEFCSPSHASMQRRRVQSKVWNPYLSLIYSKRRRNIITRQLEWSLSRHSHGSEQKGI